jgi:UDP:flavonoid glycosyltransferase YjiC (YdhE family)
MLCTSNGTGLGHLSRVMSLAEQLRDDFNVVIFTLSAAVSVAVNEGFHTEYLRSREFSGLTGTQWNSLLAQRFEHLISLYRPSLVLFDGTHPYIGMCRVLDEHDEIVKVWERRAMWREGLGHEAMARSRHFDFILEPGDYAAAFDRGLAPGRTDRVQRVGPMRYGPNPGPRAEIRAELGLDEDRPAVLVQLGAGQINDVGSMISRVCSRLLEDQDMQVVVGASVLSKAGTTTVEGVQIVQKFPISSYFSGFDFGFFAAGYNSFHEALSLGLPSVFVPNRETRLDDQPARSRFATDAGVGLEWDGESEQALDHVVSRLRDPDVRIEMEAAMSTLPPADGAAGAASFVRQLIGDTGTLA